MKKSIIPICFVAIALLFSSFTIQNSETPVVLQQSFDIKKLHNYFDKDESGELLPITLVTNDYFSDNLSLAMDGKKINLLRSKNDLQDADSEAFVNVTKFKIRKNTAVLKFKYKTKKVKIKLRKQDGEWIYKTLVVKGDGKMYADTNVQF
ncbi:MAG: hypothetical protein AAF573_05015 [Bacteroidota bacterium]